MSAYTLWGVFPLYFRLVAHVFPVVVLCHRILWSVLFVAGIITWRREWRALGPVFTNRRSLLFLAASAVLVALNWLIFIYAVGSRQVLQASLGYFINPLLSIALGMFFLRERLRPLQWGAVIIALLAVVNLAVRGEGFPWIAVSLAASFGFYGLVRKKVDINSLHALLVESTILFPAALVALAWMPQANLSAGTWGVLSLSGIITAVPLLLFGAALRKLPLSTIGFLQYIGPTLQFLVAVVLFHEHLDAGRLLSFGLCWIGIGVYVLDSILSHNPQPIADEPD